MTQYPGPDPDDPFSRPPNEEGANPPAPPSDPPPAQPSGQPPAQPSGQAGTEETAPIQGEEMGYWERKAQEDQQRLTDEANQQAQSAEQPPGQGQPEQPVSANPWSGYGQPAPTTPYQQGYEQQGYAQPAHAQPAYGQPGSPAYGYAVQPPNHPQATTALVVGLVSLIGGCLCGLPLLAAPFAWSIGAKVKREVAASNGQLGGEGNGQAGFIMGIIGTVLLVLLVLLLILFIGLGVASDNSSGTSTQY